MILAKLAASYSRAFSPADLSPKVWLDAADTGTITEVGGSVSQWDNKGSLGDFIQGSGTYQPTTGATTLNGLNVIDFANDYLYNATTNDFKFLHDGTKYIIGAVWQWSDEGNRSPLLNNSRNSSYAGINYSVHDDSFVDALLHQVFRAASGTSAVQNISGASYWTADTWGLTTLLADPTNATAADRSFMYLDNGAAVQNNAETGSVSGSNPTYNLHLGAYQGLGYILEGKIAEVIIVDGTNATAGNLNKIRNYLNSKWSVY